MAVKEIRIRWAVDNSRLEKAEADIKRLARELGVSEGAVRKVNDQMKAGAGLIETLRAKGELLRSAMEKAHDPKKIREFNAELKKTQAEIDKLQNGPKGGLQRMQESLSGMGLGALGLTAAIGSAAFGIGAFVGKGIQLAASMEQSRISMENFTGSAEAADALLKQIETFAAKTPFEFPELIGAAKRLLAFGVGAGDVEEKLRRLGDLAAGTGKPIEELAQIYGKMLAKGKASMEELNQLSEAGVPIIQALADSMGVTTAQVFKLSEQGKIGFAEVEKALNKMTDAGGKFAGLTEKQSKSFSGLMSTLRDNIGATARSLGEKLL